MSLKGPVYMEKSCPGQESHPSGQVNLIKQAFI